MSFSTGLFEITSPPGDTLLETLNVIGMSQAELALRTGRPLKTINEIIKGKAAITPATALQLERVLGIPAGFWNNRERQYRESQARVEERKALAKYQIWLREFPIQPMIERCWIQPFDDEIDQLAEVLKFFGIATPDQWQIAWEDALPDLPKHPAYQSAPGSVTAWLRQGEIAARELECEPFNARRLKDIVAGFREFTEQPAQSFLLELQERCRRAGVAVCVVPDLPDCALNLAARWLSPQKVLIQLSTRYQHDDAFWFAFYQAVGHILLQRKRHTLLEPNGAEVNKEQQVEQFIREQLFPAVAWTRELQATRTLGRDVIARIAKNTGVSVGLVVGRLQKDGIIRIDQFNDLKRQLVWLDVCDEGDEVQVDEDDLGVGAAQNTGLPDSSLSLDFWPGLSAAARHALSAVGLAEEAGSADERLFAGWMNMQLANIETAYTQGYLRDALLDLDQLIAVLQFGARRSPAFDAMRNALELLKRVIYVSEQAKPEQELLNLARQAILQVNEKTQDRLVSEARRMYSYVATQNESDIADQLFRNR
ncbi:MAG: transcriptional regulator [Chloroflexota bacterium]